jgi:hypothetical protein
MSAPPRLNTPSAPAAAPAAIVLRYRPTLAEQREAARAYQRTTRKFYIYRALSLVSLAIAVWALLGSNAAISAPIWLVLAAFTWFDPLPLLMVWLSFRGTAKDPPYQAAFSATGVTFDIAGSVVTRGWERYKRLLETPRLIILIYGSWTYSVIPRRAAGDAAAQEQLLALLRQKIQPRGTDGKA